MPRDTADWGQLLAGTGGVGRPHPMPRRALDGIVAESLTRPVWCLVEEPLARAGLLDALIELLSAQGRQVVLLSTRQEGRAGGIPRSRSVPEACRRLGVSAADVVLVGTDLDADAAAFPPSGARQLVLGPGARARRGTIALPGLTELRDLFHDRSDYRSGSTYHEA